jgi:serine/threonine protein kinase
MASRGVPETIGRFTVQALLGAGGMGEVYKAIDPTLRRTVAVKTVRPDITNPDYLSRLLREAQACASLHHPNIVTVFDAGEIDGAIYIVMEYLEGEDLAQVLNRGGLTFEERIRTLMQILDALEHAHSKGVIHRDIKPSNVRRLPNGTIKLVDFGLARMTRADTLTATGTVMGTPHYASPEQLQGQPVDRRTDIYSTGTMAYEMCSGRRPFDDENASLTSILLKVVTEPPPPMNVTWSHAFPEIERIVNRAMAKKREDRYQSAEDMKNALAAFLSASGQAIASEQARWSTATTPAGDDVTARIAQSTPTMVNQRDSKAATMPPSFDDRTHVADQPRPAAADFASRLTVAPPPAPARSRTLWWAGGTAAAAAVAFALIGWPAGQPGGAETPPPVAKKVYFTQGHGEKDIAATDRSGMSGIAQALTADDYSFAALVLAQQKDGVPADATVVVIAGPQTDFLPTEMDAVKTYVAGGGKVMLLLDPVAKAGGAGHPLLTRFLMDWGINAGNDVVLDASGVGQQFGADASVPVTSRYSPHAITEGFSQLTAYPLARSMTAVEGGSNSHIAQPLVSTGANSWAEVDMSSLSGGQVAFDADKGDRSGPITLGAAVSAPVTGAPDPERKRESRIVGIGDSDFAGNAGVGTAGNRDFFMNAINWLAQQENPIANRRPISPESRSTGR